MRVLTIAGRGLAAMLGLSVLCIVLALWFFNPNAQRDRIAGWVSDQTGRSFTFEGEIKWRLWPHLQVTLPHTVLGAARTDAGIVATPIAQWQHATIGVAWWPLLRGHLQFGPIELHGLRVALQRNAHGKNNWQDLVDLLTAKQQQSRWQFDRLASLQLYDAAVRFDDDLTSRSTRLQVSSLQIGELRFDQPVSVQLVAQLHGESAAQRLDWAFTLGLQGQSDRQLQHLELRNLQASGPLSFAGMFAQSEAIQSLPLSIVLPQFNWQALPAQLGAHAARIQVGDALITGDMNATQLAAQPLLAAALHIEVPRLRQWLQTLGVTVPVTRDADVLQSLNSTLQIHGTATQLEMLLAPLQLDQTQVVGQANWVREGQASRYRVVLQADRLNLDRYLPVTPSSAHGEANEPVPLDWLHSLHAQGRLRIDRAQLQSIRARQLTIELDGE